MKKSWQPRLRQFLVLLGALFLTVGSAGLASAGSTGSAAQPASEVGPTSATLGQACVGPFGNVFVFTINATANVPAGSTWTASVSRVDNPPRQFQVTSNSSLVQVTALTPASVQITAPAGIPAGTVVELTPSNIYIPVNSSTSVTLSGYGGSTSATWRATSGGVTGPCG